MGQVLHRHTTHDTQPMWHSLQRTLTNGTSTSKTHTAHMIQSAADSHTWDKYITWLVIQSAPDSQAWDQYITDTHSPCGTVCSGLSRMGQVHHTARVVQSTAHSHAYNMYITQLMWYNPQQTLTHGISTSLTYSLCGMCTTLIFIIANKYY